MGAVLQKRLTWALFVLLLATLVCCQPTVLVLGFFASYNFQFYTPPPQDSSDSTVTASVQSFMDNVVLPTPAEIEAYPDPQENIAGLLTLHNKKAQAFMTVGGSEGIRLHFGSKKTCKISIVFEDLSRKAVVFRNEVNSEVDRCSIVAIFFFFFDC